MAYTFVVFDFDGTLADSIGWMYEIINEVADRHRFRRVDDAEIDALRGVGNREIMARLGVRPWQLPWIARDVRRMGAAAADRIGLFDGVEALLADLSSSGVGMAIVSSNTEPTIRRILGPASAGRIGHYRCGVSIFGKAGKLRKLVRDVGARPEEVLCVGDETRDVEAAQAAGLAAASVTWGYARREALETCGPQWIVDSIDELAAAIRS